MDDQDIRIKLAICGLAGTLTKRLQISCFVALKESLFSSIHVLFKKSNDKIEEQQQPKSNDLILINQPSLNSVLKNKLINSAETNIAIEGQLRILNSILENLDHQVSNELDESLLEIILLADNHASKDINALGYLLLILII